MIVPHLLEKLRGDMDSRLRDLHFVQATFPLFLSDWDFLRLSFGAP